MSDMPQFQTRCHLIRRLSHCVSLLRRTVARRQEKTLTTCSLIWIPCQNVHDKVVVMVFRRVTTLRMGSKQKSSSSGKRPSDFNDPSQFDRRNRILIPLTLAAPQNGCGIDTVISELSGRRMAPVTPRAEPVNTEAPVTPPFQHIPGRDVAPTTPIVKTPFVENPPS